MPDRSDEISVINKNFSLSVFQTSVHSQISNLNPQLIKITDKTCPFRSEPYLKPIQTRTVVII